MLPVRLSFRPPSAEPKRLPRLGTLILLYVAFPDGGQARHCQRATDRRHGLAEVGRGEAGRDGDQNLIECLSP